MVMAIFWLFGLEFGSLAFGFGDTFGGKGYLAKELQRHGGKDISEATQVAKMAGRIDLYHSFFSPT